MPFSLSVQILITLLSTLGRLDIFKWKFVCDLLTFFHQLDIIISTSVNNTDASTALRPFILGSTRLLGQTRNESCNGRLSILNNVDRILCCCCALREFWNWNLNYVPTDHIFWSWGGSRQTRILIVFLPEDSYLHVCQSLQFFLDVFSHPSMKFMKYSLWKTLHPQYLLGWKAVARCCWKFTMGFS